MRQTLWPLGALTLSLGGFSCAHAQALDARVHQLRALTQEARDQGAYRCAPEELARSEAHLEFAAQELEQGDGARAREHLTLARANAQAALRLSTDARCAAASPSAPEARARARSQGDLTHNTAHLTTRRGSTKEHAAI